MKIMIGLIAMLLISLNVEALPKASDFKEVGVEEQEIADEDKVLESEKAKANAMEKAKISENEEVLTGTVRVIRKIEMTEVFFKDIKDSYYIPSGSKYSSIYKALDESLKKGSPVSFRANTKKRRVLSLESAPIIKTTETNLGGEDLKSPTSSSGGSK